MRLKKYTQNSKRKITIISSISGYQRELTFKHPNGAYSAWGTRDYRSPNGSNWLTAYVIRVFALSDKYIFIDPREQEVSMAFLESTQDKDGCFPQVNKFLKAEKNWYINSMQVA